MAQITIRGKHLLLVLALCLAIGTGINWHHRPLNEIAYNLDPVLGACAEGSCVRFFIAQIGNTGRTESGVVRVSFNKEWTDNIVIPLTLKRFGQRDFPFQMVDEGAQSVLLFSELPPGVRLTMRFAIQIEDSGELPDWEDLAVTVSSPSSKIVKGLPEGIWFGRFLYRVVEIFF